MHYDNLEIGTCDFGTLIGKAPGNGISVEPLKRYFDKLPKRRHWHRVQAAVSDTAGECDIFYTDLSLVTDQPKWVRGCNSLHKPHPTINRRWPHLIKSQKVKVITIRQLFDDYDVTSLGHLKIDTEGHDTVILNDYLDRALPLARRITFESNVLTSEEAYDRTVDRLRRRGYYVVQKKADTVCRLD